MDYKDFTESERKFYLQEAGFNSREEKLFRLRDRKSTRLNSSHSV